MNLKEFIECVINDSVDFTRNSPHLIFPIYVNGVELDWGDISVDHNGRINLDVKEPVDVR